MQSVTFKVAGMSCHHCVNSIQRALNEIGASGQVDLSAKTVSVAFDESRLSLVQVKEAIKEQGYDVV